MRTGRVVLCSLVALLLGACRDRGLPGEQRDPVYAKQNLLSAEPTPKFPVNADLGGKVVYLGADLDRTELKPGDKFTVVHYYKVVQAPGSEYRLFTHVKGTGKDWMNVDATKMRSSYPVADWKPGDIVRDEQTITLKGDWSSPVATVHVGLYRKGDSSEKARLPVVSGPNDGHGAVIVGRMTVSGAKAAVVPPPTAKGYVIRRASGPITIDGKADEPSWAEASSTGGFKDAEGTSAPVAATSARFLWDDKHLYVFFDVADGDAFSQFKKPDDPLWKEDTVELFIDADRSGRGYIELQVNPNNAQFDSWFATTRAQPGDEKWTSGMISAVVVDGTTDKRDDADTAWHVELAIPLEAVKGKDLAMPVTLPPRPGDTWKLNLVRVEKAKDAKQITASAWAQISMADFHAIDKLLTLTFGDEKGEVAAAAPAAPGATIPLKLEPRPIAPLTPAPGAPAPAVAPAPTPQ